MATVGVARWKMSSITLSRDRQSTSRPSGWWVARICFIIPLSSEEEKKWRSLLMRLCVLCVAVSALWLTTSNLRVAISALQWYRSLLPRTPELLPTAMAIAMWICERGARGGPFPYTKGWGIKTKWIDYLASVCSLSKGYQQWDSIQWGSEQLSFQS